MHPDAAKNFDRLFDLVESGEVPESAIPRLFAFGHECTGSLHQPVRQMFCRNCQKQWQAQFKDDDRYTCPACGIKDEGQWEEWIFDVTDERKYFWRCRDCKHEWLAEDGHNCPACGSYRES